MPTPYYDFPTCAKSLEPLGSCLFVVQGLMLLSAGRLSCQKHLIEETYPILGTKRSFRMGVRVGSAAADDPEGPRPKKKKVSIEVQSRSALGT